MINFKSLFNIFNKEKGVLVEEDNNTISDYKKKYIIIAFSLIIISLIIIIYMIYSSINQYFINYLHGFWIGTSEDGEFMIYINNDDIRIIIFNEITQKNNEYKCSYDLNLVSYFDLELRKYKFKIYDLPESSNILKSLNSNNLYLDLYSIENTCIINTDTEDILILTKDHKSNLSLMV